MLYLKYSPVLIWIIPLLLTHFFASLYAYRTYMKFSGRPVSSRFNGFETARTILDRNGLTGVSVLPAEGLFVNYYNYRTQQIVLMRRNFFTYAITSVAIAAHETAHAIRHRESPVAEKTRRGLIRAAQVFILLTMLAFLLGFISNMPEAVAAGILFLIALTAVNTAVWYLERKISSFALTELKRFGIISPGETKLVGKVLIAASLTYLWVPVLRINVFPDFLRRRR